MSFALKDLVPVVVIPQSADKLDVRIGSARIEVSAPNPIEGIALTGSGMDATFEPFAMLAKDR